MKDSDIATKKMIPPKELTQWVLSKEFSLYPYQQTSAIGKYAFELFPSVVNFFGEDRHIDYLQCSPSDLRTDSCTIKLSDGSEFVFSDVRVS